MLGWYDSAKRDLPWRRSRDPYRIWISEIMLQQTRVETVIPYYERFLSNFPTIADLATAEPDRLLNLWAGLGYYSRARNLQAAAQDIMARFGGVMPTGLEDLRSLRGIGAYTSAAIASIAFGSPHPALDGNLERVLSRLAALRADPKREGRLAVETLGQSLVDLGRAGDVNQALMDLSAALCLPKEPRCLTCPVSPFCEAQRLGLQKEIPIKKAKAAPIELAAEGVALLWEDSLLLARRPEGAWLSGMWDLPWWLPEREASPQWQTAGAQFARCAQKRTITKHKIHFQVHGIQCESEPNPRQLGLPGSDFRWVSLGDLHGVHLPRPSERALESLLQERK